MAQSVWRLATDWTVLGSYSGGDVQNGPGAYPASYTLRTGSLPGVKRPGSGVDHAPYLAPRLKKEQRYTSILPLSLRGLF